MADSLDSASGFPDQDNEVAHAPDTTVPNREKPTGEASSEFDHAIILTPETLSHKTTTVAVLGETSTTSQEENVKNAVLSPPQQSHNLPATDTAGGQNETTKESVIELPRVTMTDSETLDVSFDTSLAPEKNQLEMSLPSSSFQRVNENVAVMDIDPTDVKISSKDSHVVAIATTKDGSSDNHNNNNNLVESQQEGLKRNSNDFDSLRGRKRAFVDSTDFQSRNDQMSSLLNLDFAGGIVDISLDEIRSYFICSLCGGYFREPFTINECLHSFCKSCLFYSYYRVKHKQCPECNITIGTDTARSAAFRSDGSLRALVEALFPAVYRDDEEKEREFYAKRGIPLKATLAIETEDTGGRTQAPSGSSASKLETSDEVCFGLVPIRRGSKRLRLPALARQCLQTSGRIKIGQIKKYIALKLSLQRDCEIDVLCNGVSLGNELSITFVLRTMWLQTSCDLELKYMLARES